MQDIPDAAWWRIFKALYPRDDWNSLTRSQKSRRAMRVKKAWGEEAWREEAAEQHLKLRSGASVARGAGG